MKTLALKSGDLDLTGKGYTMVEGVARVQQQIGLCLREPFGSDRFHTRWGSVLPSWIGTVIRPGDGLQMELRAEIIRVIKNYVSAQDSGIEERAVLGLRPVVSPSETLIDVTDISIMQQEDTLIVKVTLRTAGGQEFSIVTAPGRTDGYTQ